MYITSLQISPCENMVSFPWNSTIVLATPAESRKAWGLKGLSFFVLFLLFVFISLTYDTRMPRCSAEKRLACKWNLVLFLDRQGHSQICFSAKLARAAGLAPFTVSLVST